jgi:hypothetical protein
MATKIQTIEIPAVPEVTVRVAGAADARALVRLAALDSAEPLEGSALIAELEGTIVAAVPLDGGPAIADPFVRTVALVEMLELRVTQIHQAQAGPARRLIRRAASRASLQASS